MTAIQTGRRGAGVIRDCQRCGATFVGTSNRQRFCSVACRDGQKRGGADTPANVQSSHLRCNIRKGALVGVGD